MSVAIVKSCACGRSFTAHDWSQLDLVGTMVDPEETIELRNCPCGSTIAIVVNGPTEDRKESGDEEA